MEIHLRSLGETLRTLRTERGLSLGDVAAGTGLSTSFLSLVENGRSDISTGRLYRLARFLGVGLGEILGMDALREPVIVRAAERRAGGPSGAEGLRTSPLVDRDGLAMAPAITELGPGAALADLERTDGIEYFVFVMEGRLEIGFAGAGLVELAAGDSAYFGSPGPVVVRNPGDAPSLAIWVTSPPLPGAPEPA